MTWCSTARSTSSSPTGVVISFRHSADEAVSALGQTGMHFEQAMRARGDLTLRGKTAIRPKAAGSSETAH